MLRNLEKDGLVKRTVYPTAPVKVESELTELEYSLWEIVDALGQWSKTNVSKIIQARADFDKKSRKLDQFSSYLKLANGRHLISVLFELVHSQFNNQQAIHSLNPCSYLYLVMFRHKKRLKPLQFKPFHFIFRHIEVYKVSVLDGVN